MGSSSKNKYKEKESRKRRHKSPTPEEYDASRDNNKYESSREKYEPPREKRHKHKHKHHRDRKREKISRQEYESDGHESDVVEIFADQPESYEKPAESSSQGAQSLSIEETNKLRAKLGLKPLDFGLEPSTSSSSKRRDDTKKGDELKKDDLGEFYHKPAENWAAKAEQEKIRAKLAEHKEKRLLQNKLSKVKTLGESDDEDNTENWVHKTRKIEHAKREAEKRAQMLEELDAQFGISDVVESEEREKRKNLYTTRNLQGLRVDHDVDSFAEERDVILTLKDKGVLDKEDEDILVNVNMVDNEKYKKNVENKKKKIQYNAYEDQEFDEFGNPKEKTLLSKYDEELEGQKRDGFKIGSDNFIERKQAAAQSIKEKLAKKNLESIPEKNLVLYSEYYNEEELEKFKKPKKKKIRKMRVKGKLSVDDFSQPKTGIEQIGSRRDKIKKELELTIDDVPSVEITTDLKVEDDDKDDILEKALSRARKMKQRENLVADIIKTEIKQDPEDENLDSGNIVLNATAEFCRTLGDIPTYGKAGNRDEDEELIDFEKDMIEENNSDDDCEIIEPTGWNSVDPAHHSMDSSHVAPQEVQILDEEPDVSTGVAAALKLAMSKGYLDKEQNNRPSNSRLAHLQAQHYSIEDKAYGDDGERSGGRGRERYCGPVSDFREKDGFKPNVKLEYIDDDGHILNSKEAFRYLSHKFHGKGPGKNKVEKRIKKGVQEQLMKKMSSTDTPLGTLNMLQAKQKETQSAFVVLSGSKQQQSTVISKNRH